MDRKEYKRLWHQRNKTRRLALMKKRKQELREWLDELKSNLKCETCGFSHIAALDFHHTDPSEKDASVGSLL